MSERDTLMEEARDSLAKLNLSLAKLQRSGKHELMVDTYTINSSGDTVEQIRLRIIEEVF